MIKGRIHLSSKLKQPVAEVYYAASKDIRFCKDDSEVLRTIELVTNQVTGLLQQLRQGVN